MISIEKAYKLAKTAHNKQKRLSGEPYFSHCQAVFDIIKNEWGIEDENILCAAYLHDCLEDSNVTIKELSKKFNLEIATLVDGVTKLKSDKDTIKKLLSISYLNPGVAIIKLADRLHNIRTLKFMPLRKRIVKSRETLDIYARLAESLGIWNVKNELEDKSYFYLSPRSYKKIKKQIDQDSRTQENFLSFIKSQLSQLLADNNIDTKIEIRQNGLYSLKRKREKWAIAGWCQPNNFNRINDLISIRCLTNNLADVYLALEIIHQHFGKIVDYQKYDEFIGANTPVNGYSAIQTTLEFPEGPVEIGITTKELEEFHIWGVVSLLRTKNPNLSDYIFKLVFTPSGAIRFLPKQATGIDFAYQLNPQLGADMTAILIDNDQFPPSAILPHSATVEVLVGPSRRAPDPEFLNYCLPVTKKMIESQLKNANRDELICKGKKILESILVLRGLFVLTDVHKQTNVLLYNLGCQGPNDLYSKIGGGYISKDVIKKELDLAKITKADLKITSIKLICPDQPGMLFKLVSIINKFKKNINNIFYNNDELRLLIQNLSLREENKIRLYLKNDKRFKNWTLV